MRIPAIKGVIDRRILVNYRVDPQVIARVLPPPFRPALQCGHAVAGICLIRLRDIRPRLLPRFIGISSENAAHRIAVEWDSSQGLRQGVFIPRRDTSSRMNSVLGGRIFPGVHHHARFECSEADGRYDVAMRSDDDQASLRVRAQLAADLPCDSLFKSIDEASGFFQAGSLGYSTTGSPTEFDGLELRSFSWSVEPLEVEHVKSSFFDDEVKFPPGSARLDCALLMRNIEHEWHSRERLMCGATAD